ncbi:MAG: GNAT family N-acetyltransferase [Candidatus Sulfotelmatobacter sp.]
MASPEIQIRLAEPQDAPAIARVLHESFVTYEALYTREGFAATTPNADQILARKREGPVWLALRGSKALGTVAAVVKGRSLYMRGMAVLPSARGLGVGARLLQQVEQWASDQGCRRVFLSTTPFLNTAIQLYERSDSGGPMRDRTIYLVPRHLRWRRMSFGKNDESRLTRN